jgi:hypothetical protein
VRVVTVPRKKADVAAGATRKPPSLFERFRLSSPDPIATGELQ